MRRNAGRLHLTVAAAHLAIGNREEAAAAAERAMNLLERGTAAHVLKARLPRCRNILLQRVYISLIAPADPSQAAKLGIAAAANHVQKFRFIAAAELLVHTGRILVGAQRNADAWHSYSTAEEILFTRYRKDPDAVYDDKPLRAAWRPIHLLSAAAELGCAEVYLSLGVKSEESHYRLTNAEALLELERPLELARWHRLNAEWHCRQSQLDEALTHYLKAFDVVDRNRYELHDPVQRVRWVKANADAHRGALRLSHIKRDHLTVCELLEVGRLQGLPRLAEDDFLAGARDIPLQPPPRVTISGQSSLIRASGIVPGMSTVDLHSLIRRAAGEHSILLTYWSNADGCYWGLLGPDILDSGLLDLSSPEIQTVLGTLRLALPYPLQDENAEEVAERVSTGAFFSDRAAEKRLASKLAAFIPDRLLTHLLQLPTATRASLTICPAPELAHVPWALVDISQGSSRPDGHHTRLIEVANIRLGLSSALANDLLVRARGDYVGEVNVVIDPSGEPADQPPDGQVPLLGARQAASRLPHGVAIHGGRWRGDGSPITAHRLTEVLASAQPGGAFVFLGHCSNPGAGGSTTEAALVLASRHPGEPPEGLTAHSLLHPSDRQPVIRFPSRAILAACNTSSADRADTGDWLGLVPAIHWCGAIEIVSSTVLIPDKYYTLETSLIRWLQDEPQVSLEEMLHTLQRDALRRWLAGERGVPPLTWAFYMHSGIPPRRNSLDEPKDLTPRDVIWSRGAFNLISAAASTTISLRRRSMHTSAVALAHMDDELYAESPSAGFLLVLIYAWELIRPDHNPIPLARKFKTQPSNQMHRLLRAAEEHASSHGRRIVMEADVLLTLAQRRELSGSWLIRRISPIRHASHRARMLTETEDVRVVPDPSRPFDPSRWPEDALLEALGFTSQWALDNAAAKRRLDAESMTTHRP